MQATSPGCMNIQPHRVYFPTNLTYNTPKMHPFLILIRSVQNWDNYLILQKLNSKRIPCTRFAFCVFEASLPWISLLESGAKSEKDTWTCLGSPAFLLSHRSDKRIFVSEPKVVHTYAAASNYCCMTPLLTAMQCRPGIPRTDNRARSSPVSNEKSRTAGRSV